MDLQTAFNIAIALVGGLGGWVLNRVYSDMNYIRDAVVALAGDLAEVRVILPTHYVTQQELSTMLDRLMHSLQRIEDKLDRKADKT